LPNDIRTISTPKKPLFFKNKEEYYKSDEWKIKRQFILNRDSHRCQQCGSNYWLEIHHLTYDRLYNEDNNSDLITLCKKCHKRADAVRASNTRYDNGLDTYASKKYGEDWEYYYDYDDIADEFDEWLERQDDY